MSPLFLLINQRLMTITETLSLLLIFRTKSIKSGEPPSYKSMDLLGRLMILVSSLLVMIDDVFIAISTCPPNVDQSCF